jgi:essential nuclear protein 1
VVDALSAHFVSFADDERQMPVVWHQCLLCFVQRYKHEIREGDKALLRQLCSKQHHYQVRPELLIVVQHTRLPIGPIKVGRPS